MLTWGSFVPRSPSSRSLRCASRLPSLHPSSLASPSPPALSPETRVRPAARPTAVSPLASACAPCPEPPPSAQHTTPSPSRDSAAPHDFLSDEAWLASLPPARPPQGELERISSRLRADRFEAGLALVPNVEDSPYLSIPDEIRHGFDLGISGPVLRPFFPENAQMTPLEVRAIDKAIEDDLSLGRLAGPYEKDDLMASTGLAFRSNPLSVVKKETPEGAPQKFRLVENLSFPYEPVDGVTSVNAALNSADFPSRWTKLSTFIDLVRRLPPGSQVLVADLEKAFRQLSIRPEQRPHHALFWRGRVFFRLTPSFGGCTTPGVFGRSVDCTLDMSEARFECLITSNIVDDLLFARFPPPGSVSPPVSPSTSDVVEFVEDLGWILNKDPGKFQDWRRVFIFGGLGFDLDREVVFLPPKKAAKYAARVSAFLEGGASASRTVKDVMTVLGTLMYVATAFPPLRPCLSHLLAFRRSFPHDASPFVRHKLPRTVRKELGDWQVLLVGASAVRPLEASFRLPSNFANSVTWTDASEYGLGVVIDNIWSISRPLASPWAEVAGAPGGIVSAEGWAVELGLAAWAVAGVEDCGLAFATDNAGVVGAWQRGRSSNRFLNRSIARILAFCSHHSTFLSLSYIHTSANPADAPSRGVATPHLSPFPRVIPPSPGTPGALPP